MYRILGMELNKTLGGREEGVLTLDWSPMASLVAVDSALDFDS